MAPELVCITWQRPGFKPQIVHANDLGALELVESWLKYDELLVGHNVVYDFAVLCAKWPHLPPLVFNKYDRNQIVCTKVRQQLLDIAGGEFRGKLLKFEKDAVDKDGHVILGEDGKPRRIKGARWIPHNYTLDDLTYRATGRRLDKDTWRLRYGKFIDTPISQWPEGARTYSLEDARATLDVFLAQDAHKDFMPDQFRQARAAWALHLTSLWGLRTHKPGVDALEVATVGSIAAIEGDLKIAGLVRENGSRNTRAAQARMLDVCRREGKSVRLTNGGEQKLRAAKPQSAAELDAVLDDIAASGGISLDSDACEASEDDLLEDYAELTSYKNVLAKDIPVLRAGTEFPVHSSFGMAASGRSTSSNPNVQNPRRLPGIREAFVPREGKVFAQADFSAVELHTLAQVCLSLFGESRLAGMLNAGLDPHTDFAATILGISYEAAMARKKIGDQVFEDARQAGKAFNFGKPGGMGSKNFCVFARKSYGVVLTEARSKELSEVWLERLPEMKLFFAHAAQLMEEGDGEFGTMQQLFSERWRGGCHFTSLCNSWFQGLAADAAKRALYLVSRACYAEPESILFGSRPVNFVHDEVIMEVDDNEHAHDKAMELGRLMVLGANEFLPDVPARVEPLLARCWSKKSKPVLKEGRLIPWSM